MNKLIFIVIYIFNCFDGNAQQWEKAKKFNYTFPYSIYRHASDVDGNIYIVGEIKDNSLELDGLELTSKGNLDIFITKLDSNFSVLWAKSYGSDGEEMVTGITLDKSGDILLSGYFSKTIIIGKDTLRSIGSSDFFLTKMDKYGNPIWSKSGGSKFQDYSYSRLGGIYTDDFDNIYVGGMFANVESNDTLRTAWFDGLSAKSHGGQDVFAAKYSATGKIIWLKNFGSYRGDEGELYGNGKFLYLCGGSNWKFNYDSLVLKNPYGGSDIGYILKMDLDGNVNWVNGAFLKDFGSMYSRSVTADSLGNLYIVGMYYPISFNNRLLFDNFELEEIGGTDIFVAKLDKNGKVRWLKRGGGYGNDGPAKIITKSDNHFIITGSIAGGGFYESKTIASNSGENTFILEIDSNGGALVFEQCGNTGNNIGTDLSITEDGKLLLIGDNRLGSLTFDSIVCQNTDKPASFYIARRNFVPKPVGISMLTVNKSFKIFPNPNNGSFTIELENPEMNAAIEVFDLLGKLVKKVERVGKVTLVALDVASGIYLVKVKNGELVWNQKMVLTN